HEMVACFRGHRVLEQWEGADAHQFHLGTCGAEVVTIFSLPTARLGWKCTFRPESQRGMHRPRTPLSLEECVAFAGGVLRAIQQPRLNSAIGYITPTDILAERQQEIRTARD